MDLLLICSLIFVIYIITCFLIIYYGDCDLLTFIASHFGKKPENELKDKVIWITGASSGIGENLAKKLFQIGAKIIISARRMEELERVKMECLEANPTKNYENILIIKMDMVDLSSHEKCFQQILNKFGKLDILVSNAGRSQRAKWQNIDLQVDKDLFELNVFSLINLNRIVLRYFMEIGKGHLVVMSSAAGVIGVPFSGSYTGSKFALHGYFGALRNEIRSMSNINITLLCPGPTFSGFMSQCFTEKVGEKFDGEMKSTDKRMTTDRCGYLCLVSISNLLEESWISIYPMVLLMYIQAYLPYFSAKLFNRLGKIGYFMKIRDTQKTMD